MTHTRRYALILSELFDQAEWGHAWKVEQLEEEIAVYWKEHSGEFGSRVLPFAITWSCGCAHVQLPSRAFPWCTLPIPLTNPECVHVCVMGAAKGGHDNLLEPLLAYWTPNDQVLIEASKAMSARCVALLLPYCNARHNGSAALQEACINDDEEVFELLLPCSDAKEAWEGVRSKHDFHVLAASKMFARLEALVQHQNISQVLNAPLASHSKERKL